MSEITKKLLDVQNFLKAPKNQFNSFGKYKYRSCEDILEAAKPLCISNNILLTLSDDVINVGISNYVKATASITDGVETISVSAMAREAVNKKGMDDSQITGTASSYARKYALNGLFCIDDTKDTDSMDNRTVEKAGPDTDLVDANKITGFHAITWDNMLASMKLDTRIATGKTASDANIIDGVTSWEKKGKPAKEICGQMIKYFK